MASAKAQAWEQAGRVQGGDCPKEEGHSQRVLWTQPGVWGGVLFGEETREEGTEAGTAWRLQSRSLANRGGGGGEGRQRGRGSQIPSALPQRHRAHPSAPIPGASVSDQESCRGADVRAPLTLQPVPAPHALFRSRYSAINDSALTAHLVPRISVQPGARGIG